MIFVLRKYEVNKMVCIALIFVKSVFLLIDAESIGTLVVSFHKMTFFNTSRSFTLHLTPAKRDHIITPKTNATPVLDEYTWIDELREDTADPMFLVDT